MEENLWKIKPGSEPDTGGMHIVYDLDKEGMCWREAFVKWDGCVYFRAAGNVPFCSEYGFYEDNRDSAACDEDFHICDVDKIIVQLLQLKEIAKKYFGDDWNL